MTALPTAPGAPIGPAQCMQDDQCLEMAQAELSVLTGSGASARKFESATCVAANVITQVKTVSGPACECKQADSWSTKIGPSGLGCYWYGRLGDCLFEDDEFSYCELGETSDCSELCAKLEERIAADAARTHSGDVKYATCEDFNCHNVLQVDDRCYADRSYRTGVDYDCALSGPEILARHEEAKSMKPTGEVVEDTSNAPESNGSLSLSVSRQFIGTKGSAPGFGAMAQFYSVTGSGERRAEIIDPLEGADDCGVRREHSSGTSPNIKYLDVESALLIDGDEEIPFELSSASNGNFYSYILGLTDLGVEPRHGGTYGFRAFGGSFGEEVNVTGIELPEALSVHELELTDHVERGPLRLTWSGRSDQPLRMTMSISEYPYSFIVYGLECLMHDDGEFEIPEAVMRAVPNGIARAQFVRENSALLHDGPKAIQTRASAQVLHEFGYGDRCESAMVSAACDRYAEKRQQAFVDCGLEAPSRDELCPGHVAQACTLCPEYYDCMARNTACTDNRVITMPGCSCPPK